MSYEAQKADIEEYPEEYQYFLQNRQGSRQVGIEIIPNLNIAHLQELRDCGILTIPKFAEMEIVPPHLEYAHAAAKVLNQALKEMTNANEENSIEESKITSPEKVQTMLETDRSEYEHNVGRRELPASHKNNEGSGDPERDEEDRQPQHDPFVSPNWSMSF